jgi:Tfp pilus assembly protein PilX
MRQTKFIRRFRVASGNRTLRRGQRGVIMIITLIALVILMIGGVALVKSFDTSLLLSGNLAFKRDLVNQGERGMAAAITRLTSSTLASEGTRQNNAVGSNYSAIVLTTDSRSGIPNALLSDSAFTLAGFTAAADITDGPVTIRYVIDRQCSAVGAYDASTCNSVTGVASDTSGSNFLKKAGGGTRPVYRISVRVTGPRNTQAYLQNTVTL